MSDKPFDFMSLEEEPYTNTEDNPTQGDVEVEQPVTEEPTVQEPEVTTEPTSTVVEEKQPYTPEEISAILTDEGFDAIDTSRLTDEGKLIMKSMQRGLTPKLQEAADLRREMESLRREFQEAKPKPQPNDIYEAYDQNPEQVMGTIDQEINRMIGEDPTTNAAQIEQLRGLKTELVVREMQKVKEERVQTEKQQQVMQQLFQAVPDLANKQTALRDFALKVMGFSEEELARETSPAQVGEAAVRTIVRINNAYDRFNAQSTVKSKEIKPQPTKVESSGGGFEAPETTHNDLRKEAMKTGDWSQVFMDLPE